MDFFGLAIRSVVATPAKADITPNRKHRMIRATGTVTSRFIAGFKAASEIIRSLVKKLRNPSYLKTVSQAPSGSISPIPRSIFDNSPLESTNSIGCGFVGVRGKPRES